MDAYPEVIDHGTIMDIMGMILLLGNVCGASNDRGKTPLESADQERGKMRTLYNLYEYVRMTQ